MARPRSKVGKPRKNTTYHNKQSSSLRGSKKLSRYVGKKCTKLVAGEVENKWYFVDSLRPQQENEWRTCERETHDETLSSCNESKSVHNSSGKKGAASSPIFDAGAWLHDLELGPTQLSVTYLRYTDGVFLITSCTHIATQGKEVKHRWVQETGDRKDANFRYGITDLTEN